MKILVDTSIWIDHFRQADSQLQAFLQTGQVWTHTVVIGELATGHLKQRTDILRHLQKLPRADEIDLDEGLHLLDAHSLAGRGLSWSDVQLLAAARIGDLMLWSRDRALAKAAADLNRREWLVDFLSSSPMKGANLDFHRPKEKPRAPDL